jgi:ABC-type bacteriocin/lantibiotic exporter with double-glycine peptidase domain
VLLAERNVIVLDEPTANLEPALAEGLLRDILAATTGCVLIVLSHTPIPAVRDVRVVNLI